MARARMAAMVYGAISHTSDFDDTHFAHVGRLSVGIYPAALAAAEAEGASAKDAVTAFLLGSEARSGSDGFWARVTPTGAFTRPRRPAHSGPPWRLISTVSSSIHVLMKPLIAPPARAARRAPALR